MSCPLPLSPLAAVLAEEWGAGRSETATWPPAVRLVLPHLVLLGSAGPDIGQTAQLLSAYVLQPAFQFSDRARLAPTHPPTSRAARRGREGGKTPATADPLAVVAVLTRAAQALAWALVEAEAPPAVLLEAWDEAANAFTPKGEVPASGRDTAGLPWMPLLGGLSSQLPVEQRYRQLGAEPGGDAAQLVLLAIAGEAGHRSLILHWETLARHTGLSVAEVLHAVARLAAEGWLEREPFGERDREVPRVVWVAPDRRAVLLRGVGSR